MTITKHHPKRETQHYSLISFRERFNLSQEDSAKLLGVNLKTWQRKEKAGVIPYVWFIVIDAMDKGLIAISTCKPPEIRL